MASAATATLDDEHRRRRPRLATPDTAVGLEQAEQQFRAAGATGYDSRALNLFYGLSQAGRALAAASPALTGDGWRLRGHGLKSAVQDDRGPWDDVLVCPDPARPGRASHGSFRVLSAVLRSPAIAAAHLAHLWPRIPETLYVGGLATPRYLHPPLDVHVEQLLTMRTNGRAGISVHVPPAVAELAYGERPTLRDWVAAYPALGPWELDLAGATADGWPASGQSVHLHRDLHPGEDATQDSVAAEFTRYRRSTTCFARLPGETAPRHPLMLWWSVLHALSTLTRYSPARWSAAIDVDHSHAATRVELLLDVALDAVPDLIDEAFDDLLPG